MNSTIMCLGFKLFSDFMFFCILTMYLGQLWCLPSLYNLIVFTNMVLLFRVIVAEYKIQIYQVEGSCEGCAIVHIPRITAYNIGLQLNKILS